MQSAKFSGGEGIFGRKGDVWAKAIIDEAFRDITLFFGLYNTMYQRSVGASSPFEPWYVLNSWLTNVYRVFDC